MVPFCRTCASRVSFSHTETFCEDCGGGCAPHNTTAEDPVLTSMRRTYPGRAHPAADLAPHITNSHRSIALSDCVRSVVACLQRIVATPVAAAPRGARGSGKEWGVQILVGDLPRSGYQVRLRDGPRGGQRRCPRRSRRRRCTDRLRRGQRRSRRRRWTDRRRCLELQRLQPAHGVPPLAHRLALVGGGADNPPRPVAAVELHDALPAVARQVGLPDYRQRWQVQARSVRDARTGDGGAATKRRV